MNDEHNKQIPEYDENLSVVNWDNLNEIGFDELVSAILNIDGSAQTSAVKAINRMQTMRNWFIGYYIVEYEQKGKERATYGAGLLKKLEKRVARKGLTETLFKWSRTFYRLYPQIRTLVSTAYSIDAPLEKQNSVISAEFAAIHSNNFFAHATLYPYIEASVRRL